MVAATDREAAPLLAHLAVSPPAGARPTTAAYGTHSVAVLVTGVGMVATAARCAQTLSLVSYDLALNVGLCGSFDTSLQPGCAVHVVTDRLAELGAEDGDQFLTAQEMKLVADDEFPFTGGRLVNAAPPRSAPLRDLPAVTGITVNTVHGEARSIAAAVARFSPQVESMEGAAFMYSCLVAGVPFAQIRAVSNRVERRNRSAWNIDGAIGTLGRTAISILDGL